MDEKILDALKTDRVIDITTTGRKTGRPRRKEIVLWALRDGFAIGGRPGRPRDWYANVVANPEFTVHVKRSAQADLRALATPVRDPAERRAIITEMAGMVNDPGFDVEARVANSPLIRVEFL